MTAENNSVLLKYHLPAELGTTPDDNQGIKWSVATVWHHSLNHELRQRLTLVVASNLEGSRKIDVKVASDMVVAIGLFSITALKNPLST
jgi:hypothetical protein